MAEAEGVIKFHLQFTRVDLPPGPDFDELMLWRDRFHALGIVGQDPKRYGGHAFGNISCRVGESQSFLISGSQTGGYARARVEHFTCVDTFNLAKNSVVAHGPIYPSSESLAHGAIYALSPAIRCVVHGHSPQLWTNALQLGLPSTAPDVAYGTPAMARAIASLYRDNDMPQQAVFSMRGHKDGIVAYAGKFSIIEERLRRDLAGLANAL